MLFGPRGGAQTRREARGRDIEAQIEVTLEEAFAGVTKSFSFSADPTEPPMRLEVRFPPASPSSKIRLVGKGGYGPTGQRGNLYLVVRMLTHPSFERRGDDLYLDVPTPFTTASLGGEIQVHSAGKSHHENPFRHPGRTDFPPCGTGNAPIEQAGSRRPVRPHTRHRAQKPLAETAGADGGVVKISHGAGREERK